MEIICSAQHQLSLVGELTGAYELKKIAAIELLINATY